MEPSNTTGEASPSNNTEQALNPITFDESALAKLLEKRFSGQEEEKNVEQGEPEAASADDQDATSGQQDEKEAGDQSESTDEVLSDEEEQGQPDEESEPVGVQKRIDKLTRAKKEALERAEALERELNDAKSKLEQLESQPVSVASNASSPFSDVWDASRLTEEYQKARDLRRWCEDNADGTELNGTEYSAEDIKTIRRRVEDAIDIHIPQRAAFLQQYQQVKPVAEKIYPWWKDRNSTEYSEAQQVLRQMPQIAMVPEYQVLIGDFIAGRNARLASEKQSKSGVPKMPTKTAPKQPSVPSASPVRVDKAKQDAAAAKAKFLKTGSTTELARLLERF